MNNRLLLNLTLVVVGCMAIILIMNLSRIFVEPLREKYLRYNDVRGSAIEHKSLLYTFNFEQQNELIKNLNHALPITKNSLNPSSPASLDFSKLIIYRFKAPDLILTPIAYDEHENLIFSLPEWNPDDYLQEISQGAMKELISTTYDK